MSLRENLKGTYIKLWSKTVIWLYAATEMSTVHIGAAQEFLPVAIWYINGPTYIPSACRSMHSVLDLTCTRIPRLISQALNEFHSNFFRVLGNRKSYWRFRTDAFNGQQSYFEVYFARKKVESSKRKRNADEMWWNLYHPAPKCSEMDESCFWTSSIQIIC